MKIYQCGDIQNWDWTDDDCKIANDAVGEFDGLPANLETWQVEQIRNDILEAIRLAKYGSKLGRGATCGSSDPRERKER